MAPGPRDSYLFAALKTRENWIAMAATVAVTAAVVAYSRTPLPAEVTVDLTRMQRFGSLVHATPVGFWPDRSGAMTTGDVARVVLNRPLPGRFELVIEGRALDAGGAVDAEVRVGASSYAARFETDTAPITLRIDNDAGAREIVLRLPAGSRLAVTRITTRALGGPA